MVALEIDGPWHELVRVDRAAGDADDRRVFDDGDAVEDDGEMALVERDGDVLPLARGLLGGDLRHDAAVVGGHVVLVHGLAVAVWP